ncbi:MAG: hypothetical protein N2035_10285 [Chthoniobacterales bacterium]|nr:hypothetical protein [Chthoniobacterales bacterium]
MPDAITVGQGGAHGLFGKLAGIGIGCGSAHPWPSSGVRGWTKLFRLGIWRSAPTDPAQKWKSEIVTETNVTNRILC